MTDEFGHWLAGFIDGEACFSFGTRRRAGGQVEITPRFALRVRGDDRPTLERIRAETGVGSVWSVKKRSHADQVEWLVGSLPDCLELVRLLERYPLRAKKKDDFKVWREAVLALESGSAPRRGARMAGFKEELEALPGRRARTRAT